jgi:hypothetical protein
MRPDRISSFRFTRALGAVESSKMQRGRLSHLLFVLTGTTFRKKDRITVKLRYNGGAINVVDRIAASDLLGISDMKYGVPAFGSVFQADQGGTNTTENENNDRTIVYAKNAILLPIGNIFLDDTNAEIEIIFEAAPDTASPDRECHFNCYSIDYSTASNHVLQWDSTHDLEAQHQLVREIYLVANKNESLFPSDSPYGSSTFTDFINHKDINVQMDVDGRTYNMDLLGLGAITSLIGELGSPANNFVRIFQDNDNLPASVWLEVSGDNSADVYIICVKELMLPSLTTVSQHELVGQAQKKMEKLENTNPEAAKAYIASGAAVSSAVLADVKEQLPAPPSPK